MTAADNPAIWVFDSACVLCDGGVHYTLKHEKTESICFVSIQSDVGRALAREHGLDPDDPQTFLFIEDGRAFEKSDAVIALARHLKGPAGWVSRARVLPKPLRDLAYLLIARNRYRLFGRKTTCMVPTPESRHRFVL